MTYRDDYRDTAHGIGIGWLIILGITLAAAAIWGISAAVSKPAGQVEAYRQKNSAENWTTAQTRFNSLFQDIQATDRKLDQAAADKKARPHDLTAAQTYTGLVSYCQSVTADYNTQARAYMASDFRDADLPAQIDTSNPLTDCKETTR